MEDEYCKMHMVSNKKIDPVIIDVAKKCAIISRKLGLQHLKNIAFQALFLVTFFQFIALVNGKIGFIHGDGVRVDRKSGTIHRKAARFISELDVDHCASAPCQHGGRCESWFASFTCHCTREHINGNLVVYSGRMCEHSHEYRDNYNWENPNHCASTPCLHNGTCENLHSTFLCHCRDYTEYGVNIVYSGKTCQHRHDYPDHYYSNYCRSSPCQNGGTCENTFSSFTCHCNDKIANGKRIVYSGRMCELVHEYKETTDVIPTTQPQEPTTVQHPTQNHVSTTVGPTLHYQESSKTSLTTHYQESTSLEHTKSTAVDTTTHHQEPTTLSLRTSSIILSTFYQTSSTKIDACSSSPCLNGGFCSVRDQSYECYCKASAVGTAIYIGKRCELEIHLTQKPDTTVSWLSIPGK